MRSPQPAYEAGWRQFLRLGEQLMAAPTLAAQRDLIVDAAARLSNGQADLWLTEAFHRLPGPGDSPAFPPLPPSELMRLAVDKRRAFHSDGSGDEGCPGVAVPLLVNDALLGVLQVVRPGGPAFGGPEVELLSGLALQAAIALQAMLQVEVERWRVEQLSLVQVVSSQVASVLDLDELFGQVVDLVLKTFRYYYVALFILEADGDSLRLGASAGPQRRQPAGQPPSPPVLHIQVGAGIIGNVAHSGEEIVANDVSREPRYRYTDALPETRAEVAFPLKIENRILGVLDVQSDQPDDFQETDLLVLRALAHNISIAVEDARLYGDLRRRAEQLSAVAEVSRAVASILDLDTLLHEVVSLIHVRFGYPFVHLFTLQPGRRQIIYQAGSGTRSRALQAQGLAYSLDDPQGIIPWVARHGETVLANEVDRDPRYRPSELPPDNTQAELTVPLVFGREVLGVLDLQSDHPHAFSDDDRFLFEALADNVAIAIRNANLYRSERWRRQVADSLREVAGLLSADLALSEVLDAILNELERMLACDAAAIWLLEDGALRPAAVRACAEHDGLHVADLLFETTLWLDQTLHADTPTIRTPQAPFEPLGAALGFPSDYSAIAAPLRVGEQRLGLLTLAHRTPDRYGSEARAMTAAFASYAAVAIENARLYETTQEQAYVSAALLQAAQAVVSLNDLDEILGAIVRIMPMLVGVEWSIIFLWEDALAAFRPVQAYGLGCDATAALLARTYAPGEFPWLDAVRQGDQVLSLDVTTDWDDLTRLGFAPDLIACLRSAAEDGRGRRTAHSLLALPLSVRGDVLGALLVEEAGPPGRFRERRVEIIAGIAQQAALTIQNDWLQREMAERERLEQELQLAREIQQTFMPSQLPVLPGWELAVTWRAARQVSGDFYDVFALPGGRLGLVIADVADKGMPAALFMALTRALLRAVALEGMPPAAVLTHVNDLLVPDSQKGMFVTAVYGVLAWETGTLAYANAGHPLPLVWRARPAALEQLKRGGIALGLFEGISLEEHVVSLDPGDHLTFYTDGVTEAFSAQGELYGEERLRSVIVGAAPGASAQALMESIVQSVGVFVGDHPSSDDMTLMVLRRDAVG